MCVYQNNNYRTLTFDRVVLMKEGGENNRDYLHIVLSYMKFSKINFKLEWKSNKRDILIEGATMGQVRNLALGKFPGISTSTGRSQLRP